MYDVDALRQLTATEEFASDRALVLFSLNELRYKQSTLMEKPARRRLGQFVECVLASAPTWNDDEGSDLCRIAGETAELLSADPSISSDRARWLRLRAALLYDLGQVPAVASTMLHDEDVPTSVVQFFRREGPFGRLNGYDGTVVEPSPDDFSLEWSAVAWDVARAAGYVQTKAGRFADSAGAAMSSLAGSIALPLFATDYQALGAVVQRRLGTATRSLVQDDLLDALKSVSFPSELWSAQSEAIRNGILSDEVRSWGMAAPTGTGKSFLTQVLIADSLLKMPEGLVLYLVPSKALVYEVSKRLSECLSALDVRVTAVTPALVDLDEEEKEAITDSSVLVVTPEKADLLVRLSAASFDRTRLAIVDEAHHIESGTRGVLLEMYLWRLKRLVSRQARFVFLSAVAPNMADLTGWIGMPARAVVHRLRPTRMTVGVYRVGRVRRYKEGWIDYEAGGRLQLFDRGVESSKRRQLVQLAEALAAAGPVLVVAKGKRECENLATEMAARTETSGRLAAEECAAEAVQRLDSRLERELYPEVPMRALLKWGIVYHHAGLPPRVRTAVEEAIRAGYVRYVFATTTLAEGVNFPFASVVVQSLALRDPPARGRPASYTPVTPRVFWNIAGRAGRPGMDREGQVILFEPSLGLDLIEYVLGDYLNPDLASISPVASALGTGLQAIVSDLMSGDLDEDWICKTRIDERTPRRVQGTVNLIRVSLVHARATGLLSSPEEILEGTFAARLLNADTLREAERIVAAQDRVVRAFFADATAPSAELAAELGLSIETLDELRTYARNRQNWQLEKMSNVLRGGEIDEGQIDYLIAPVASRMGELDGGTLGGFVAAIVRQWILGVPFSRILRDGAQSVEDLVSVVYSRIQYLLPWGLYAFDRLVEEEAARRNIHYNNAIRSVAYLVDAGVPGFDALRLTRAEIERVDATRLAQRYKQVGGLRLGVDVVGWVSQMSGAEINDIVSGTDRRRVDFDLPGLVKRLSGE